MSEHTSYRLGPDMPDEEELRDSHGWVIDEDYVRDAVEEAKVDEAIDQVRGRGRPSLFKGRESPLMRVRLLRELDEAIRDAARRAGASRSEWVRRALDEAVHRAS